MQREDRLISKENGRRGGGEVYCDAGDTTGRVVDGHGGHICPIAQEGEKMEQSARHMPVRVARRLPGCHMQLGRPLV